MKKSILMFLPLLLIGCDGLGSKKTKTITELTPKLSLESEEPIRVAADLKNYPFNQDIAKQKAYNIAKKRIISSPTFVKGVLYVIDDAGKVSAFSKKDKKILWTQDISHRSHDHNHLGGGIVYNNEKLFITNGSRFLIVLDSKTGYEIIRKEFPDIIRVKPVMLNNQIILIQTVSNQVFTYDFVKSKSVWQHEGMFETLSSSFYIKPILYNSNVLVNYSSGQVFSLNANTGEENWSLNLSQGGDVSLPSFEAVTVSCDPIIEGDNIYVASNTGKLMKIALGTGEVIWQAKASDVQSMTLSGNSLFITNNAKQVAAISTLTGKVKWVADLELNSDKRKSKPVRFLDPFISKNEKGFVLSIVADNGQIYNFQSEDGGSLPLSPTHIIKGLKNTHYMGATCCGDIYLVNDKQIIFVE